jgi:hypothetical protein
MAIIAVMIFIIAYKTSNIGKAPKFYDVTTTVVNNGVTTTEIITYTKAPTTTTVVNNGITTTEIIMNSK